MPGRLVGEEVPGDPAKCSLSPLGLGMSLCSGQACGVAGAKSLRWQYKARDICLGRDRRVEVWPRFEMCGYPDGICSNIGARSGQKSRTDHGLVH